MKRRLEGFVVVVAAAVATLMLPPQLYAQGDPAPRGNAGANLPSSPADRGGGGGTMSGGGGAVASGGGASGGTWSGGGATGGGTTGGGWSDPSRGAIRRMEYGGLAEGSRRYSSGEATAAQVPWYSRDRGDRPLTGTPAGREGGSGHPPPPGWTGGGNNDWWYWGYGYGAGYFYYPGYRFTCGPMYGYGGFGLGYFYYDPLWWSYRYGCDPYWGWVGYGGWGDFGGGGYSGGGGSGYPQSFAEAGLKLKVKPSDAQVFVDGYFAGQVDEFDGAFQRLPMKAGTHKIEIRAPGYAPLTFDITVERFQTTTYKGELQKLQ